MTANLCPAGSPTWSQFAVMVSEHDRLNSRFPNCARIVDHKVFSLEAIHVSAENVEVHVPWQRDSLVYQLRTRSQSTTWTSLEHDEFAGRRCVALSILVQKDEGPSLSLAGPACLAIFL